MNVKNSSELNDPSTIMHSMIPSSVIAGSMEYLAFVVSGYVGEYKMMGYIHVPLSPLEDLLSTRTKAFECPRPVTQVRPAITGTFINENQMLRLVVPSNCKPELCTNAFVTFESLLCYLSSNHSEKFIKKVSGYTPVSTESQLG